MKSLTKVFTLLSALLIGLLIGRYIYSRDSKTIFSFVNYSENPVGQTTNLLKKYYVEPIDISDIQNKAIKYITQELDPHSRFIPADEVPDENERMSGNFSGIGIEFSHLKDTIYVLHAIAGGPSEKLGIRSGDKIISIDDTLVAGKGFSTKNLVGRLKGEKGTKVKVSILRKEYTKLIEFNIVRDQIPLYSVDCAFMLENKTGYIKVNRFSATTYDEFLLGAGKLLEKGMKFLIVDVRGNGGGYLQSVIDISKLFLNKGDTIVYTSGRNSPKQVYFAHENGFLSNLKIAISVDEGSASASEILAGAIQDNDRGFIYGRRTFGKGLVQNSFNLNDGSLLLLTVAKYYTPSGRNIQKPYKLGEVEEYYKELTKRFNQGEIFDVTKFSYPDSLKYKTKNERTVFGGGGIMPDFFIPSDTSEITEYFSQLFFRGIFYRFSLKFVDDNRKSLEQKFPTLETFNSNFKVTDMLIDEMIEFSETEKLSFNRKDFLKSKKIIKLRLKYHIANYLMNSEAGYFIMAKEDVIVKSIMKHFRTEEL